MASTVVLGVGVVAVIGLLGCSAFFSSAEMAIFSLDPDWNAQTRSTDRPTATLADLMADPHRLLVTLLVGNNVVNVAIASVLTMLVAAFLPPGPAVLATTVVASLLVLIFGEIVPKAYGLGNAREWAITVAPVITAVEWLLSPLISVLDWLTSAIHTRLNGDRGIERPYLE